MQPTKRIWKRVAIAAAFLVLAFFALGVWNKYDFCHGWANHYASRANQLRAEAQNPGLTPDQRREHLIAADWHNFISRKYAMTAGQPWRPYPGYPLITPEEQRIPASNH
ncbi:MAG: hypothetical protein IT581_16205 [Verrucomicrobiales bacterium]|nr:hypothetical protein [Verrucomicrobiales bacterium]